MIHIQSDIIKRSSAEAIDLFSENLRLRCGRVLCYHISSLIFCMVCANAQIVYFEAEL